MAPSLGEGAILSGFRWSEKRHARQCATNVLVKLERWRKRHPEIAEPIEVVFEAGDTHQQAFKVLLSEFESAPVPIFKPKSLAPLQIGDFVAWQHVHALHNIHKLKWQRWEQIPALYKALIRHENSDPGIYGPKELVEFCKAHNVPERKLGVVTVS